MRLDQKLVALGLAPSRTRAQSIITAGKVRVAGRICTKASENVREDCMPELIAEDHPYVSRGGLKLEAALDHFGLDPTGCTALDIGISTGGFTHCLLLRGARHVYGIDVGTDQLAPSLREHPAITLHEQCNIRDFSPDQIPEKIDWIVIDVSFISLTKVIPLLPPLLACGGELIALIKPQFEVGKQALDKRGIVRNPESIPPLLETLKHCTRAHGFIPQGMLECPLPGGDGNREFLLWARRHKRTQTPESRGKPT